MDLRNWVRSFAHRKLRKAARYSNVEHIGTKFEIPTRPQETLIGVYTNSPSSLIDAIGITDCGLHINSETKWRWVAYEEIRAAHLPVTLKDAPFESEFLDIELRSDEILRLPIRGHSGEQGQFSDVYCFEGFLAGISRRMR
eukprot:TRINITY_DN1505_c0_g1_i3.p1 TRINITY_DN1505_c0_g1~~TRINITY_DN1505_c0_g1_i3.p1  ORF type:complete len:141 (+),score=1.07 TRINITY_DN1505_c0_g1_i3:157-579(+)